MNMGMTFHQTLIHPHANLTMDQMIGLHIITGSNLKWPTFSTVVTRCPLRTSILFSSCGPLLSWLIMICLLSQITLKCTTPSTQSPLGDLPWEFFSLEYNGDLPEGNVPSWMSSEYNVWF